jgi:predicted ATP-dependent endonuclease of OLD family
VRTSRIEAIACPVYSDLRIPATVSLIGPNNGGKTTVLRAIKFGFDTFQLCFGDRNEPNLQALREPELQIGLALVGNRLGVNDLTHFYFGRTQQEPSTLEMIFITTVGDVSLEIACLANSNNVKLTCQRDNKLLKDIDETVARQIVNELYSFKTHFVQPVGTISPREQELSWPALQQLLAQGKTTETWRNQLHWLNEGEKPESFQHVVNLLKQYISNVDIKPPSRTRESNPPNVIIHYEEDNIEYDISASGGGVRTLLTLATAMELSKAPILLFDEPDAHLHSSIQRQLAHFLCDQASDTRQVIMTTHAPDIIEEVPIESLVWVDRNAKQGKRCGDVGKALVDLGAISHSQALQFLGADTVLFFEAKPDRTVFEALMKQCGKHHVVARSRLTLLDGYGDIKHLSGMQRLVRTLHTIPIAVAVIRDADYTQLHPELSAETKDGILVLRLPCKELENLLLLSAETITKAAQRAAEARATMTTQPLLAPPQEEVEEKIRVYTQTDDVRRAIEDQWIFRWCALEGGLKDPG